MKDKVLLLRLHKHWFDLTASGLKLLEYREDNPYWRPRLLDKGGFPKQFDLIKYVNGFGKSRPWCVVRWTGLYFITAGIQPPENNEPLIPGQHYLAIGNGEVVETGNWVNPRINA